MRVSVRKRPGIARTLHPSDFRQYLMEQALRKALLSVLVVLGAILLAPHQSAQGVILGQTDTFQDGTTMGWFVPGTSPVPPDNAPSGGPDGAGDAFLSLIATGSAGPGSRLSVLNGSQWTGDYLAAGVIVIRMDVNNFGQTELHLRLLFEDFEGGASPVNLALSASAVIVPAGSGWITVDFPISLTDLVDTVGTVTGALSDTDTLRIFHNPDPTFPGPGAGIPAVSAILGVDNISGQILASQIPVPPTVLLIFAGLVGLFVRRVEASGRQRRSV